jgi:hypothetical protein
MRDERVAEELVRPGVSFSSTKSFRSFRLCISDLINLHSSGVAGCKDIPAKQCVIFFRPTILQNCLAVVTEWRPALCSATRRPGQASNAGVIPSGISR